MLEKLEQIDASIFLFINGANHPILDFLMYWISSRLIWIPVYLLILFLIYKKFGVKRTLLLTACCLAAVALANTVSVIFFKEVFQRYRPCHNLLLMDKIHLVPGNNCGGTYGFVSSHAVNFFSFCTFLWLTLKPVFRYAFLVFFSWAFLVSYSRIYLGVHYPSDVFVGGLIGILFGVLFFYIYLKIQKRIAL